MECKLCGREISIGGLGTHFRMKHNTTIRDYYDQFMKKPDEGTCEVCNNPTKWKSVTEGYYRCCSIKCTANSKKTRDKTLNTNKEKFGCEYPFAQNEESIKKRDQTNLERHGVTNPGWTLESQEKIHATCQEKFGTDYAFQAPEVIKKIDQTNLIKYGCKNPSSSPIIKHKRKLKRFESDKIRLEKLLLTSKYTFPNTLEEMYFDKNKRTAKCYNCGKDFLFETFSVGFIRCPHCIKKSFLEQEMNAFLNSLNIQFKHNDRLLLDNHRELDFLLPDHKLAIEMNGLFYHSEMPIICDFDKDKLPENKDVIHELLKERFNYHYDKYTECKNKGIQLIHIFEDEWIDKQEICKSRIKHLLGMTQNKIGARECEIKEIDYQTSSLFLDENHIQGKDSAGVRIGAFHNNQLISVMTFSKPNISKGGNPNQEGTLELSRFAIKQDWSVSGIAQKLLNFFTNKYKPKQVFSYADLRWSSGNLYKQLGFTETGHTGLNYWYTNTLQRIHRFGMRKKADEPKNIPEWILRAQQGWFRLWDCGNMKYIKEYNLT